MMSLSTKSLQIIGTLATCSCNRPLERVQKCLQNHGNQAKKRVRTEHVQKQWATELIQDVCSKEPVIDETKLTFIPKMSLLPLDVQRNILALLVQHLPDIATDDLKSMIPTLELLRNKDGWCDFHIDTLCNHIKSNSQCEGFTDNTLNHHKVSKTSQSSFEGLCEELFGTDKDDTTGCSGTVGNRCNLSFDWFKKASQVSEVRNMTNESSSQEGQTKEENGVEWRCPQDNEGNETNKTSAIKDKEQHQHQDQMTPIDSSRDGDAVEIIAVVSEAGGDSTKIVKHRTNLEGTRQEDNPANPALVQDVSEEAKPGVDISPIDEALKRKMAAFKTELYGCSTGSVLSAEAQEACKQILHSPSQVAETLWRLVGVSDVPLAGLECLCQLVTQSMGAAELSYTAASVMASSCFHKKLVDSASAIPRVLSSTLFTFAKAFPKPTIGVLLQLVISQDLTASLADLVGKMGKDALDSEHRIHLLNGVLQSKELKWAEQHTNLIQSILNTKPGLDEKDVSALVASIVQPGMEHHSCKKFAKLLLFIINQYGKQMSPSDVRNIHTLVAANQTFLKKAAQNALKKLYM